MSPTLFQSGSGEACQYADRTMLISPYFPQTTTTTIATTPLLPLVLRKKTIVLLGYVRLVL